MHRLLNCIIGFFLVFSVVSTSSADVLVDWSPELYGDNSDTKNWSNVSYGQNFGELLHFNSDVVVTGMDVWAGAAWGYLGDSVTLRFWSDNSGTPGAIFSTFQEQLSVIDSDGVGSVADITRRHVDFTNSVLLTANTSYWVGMSGTTTEIALMGLSTNSPGDGTMAQFNGINFSHDSGPFVGDMAFRLYGSEGEMSPTPEPTTMILFGLGLLGVAGVHRKKTSVVSN